MWQIFVDGGEEILHGHHLQFDKFTKIDNAQSCRLQISIIRYLSKAIEYRDGNNRRQFIRKSYEWSLPTFSAKKYHYLSVVCKLHAHISSLQNHVQRMI